MGEDDDLRQDPPRPGEVWRVDFGEPDGHLAALVHPAVVVSAPEATWPEVRLVVPITELKEHRVHHVWMVELRPRATNGLTKLSHADTSLVRAVNVDPACFLECLGSLGEPDLERVRRTLALVLDIKADWRPRAGG